MDKTALVKKDFDSGNRIVALLAASGIEIEDAIWVYSPEAEEWRLMVVTPLVERKGERDAYLTVLSILEKAGLSKELPWRRISLVSDDDPLLEKVDTSIRLDEAFAYEGSIHIVQFPMPSAGRPPKYHVTFAPYRGPGGAVPAREFSELDQLKKFLRDEIGADEHHIRQTLGDLSLHRTTSIPNVHMETKDLRRLHLLPPALPRRAHAQ